MKKEIKLLPEKKKLAKKIHKWAFLDAKKNPQKFHNQFAEIWNSHFSKIR